jgi:serine/threonine-protein kinase SRPK3
MYPSGNWIAPMPIPEMESLESSEENLTGDEQKKFLEFLRCMLQWRPEDRMTAKQLLDHPWVVKRY